MDHKTLSLDAYHYAKQDAVFINTPEEIIYELDWHNINGFTETVATNNALKAMGHKLPFIITRSSIFGSGAYAQHWTGDNGATWEFLAASLNEIFNFQLFGIPFTGVDICGFALNTTPELCARWMQVGLLYPFSRNHNANDTISQEPYAFPTYPYVLESSRASIKLRYRLLKYYYHLFVKQNSTGTVFKPLFFEFPNDNEAYQTSTQSSEFMLGDSILVTPVLKSGNSQLNITTLNVYIPASANFIDFYTGKVINSGYNSIDVPFSSTVPMFLREGKIIHLQNVNGIKRSRELNNRFRLAIAFAGNDQYMYASGTILSISNYSDDNIIANCMGTNSCVLNITAQATSVGNFMTFSLNFVGAVKNATKFDSIFVDGVDIYGAFDFNG